MAKKYLISQPTPKQTPQSMPIPGKEKVMVQNKAGGYVYAASNWERMERFLILGTEGGTYYTEEFDLTKENIDNLRACLNQDWKKTVDTIVQISDSGRAPKNDPAIYALAVAASEGSSEGRGYALSKLSNVCRIGTHLFNFCAYIDTMRGWGPALRNAVSAWYTSKENDKLAYQLVKYQQRNGWSHRDVLRKAHPRGQNTSLMRWAVGKPFTEISIESTKSGRKSKYAEVSGMPIIIQAFEDLKANTTEATAVEYIQKYGLTHEMIPTELLKSPAVWDALLQKMPLTAMIRSLGRMSAIGLIAPLSEASKLVVKRLGDTEYLHKSRVHPFSVLTALNTYRTGQGGKGKLTWVAVPQVVDALDNAFYAAFKNVEPTGKNFYLGVDVSGSMGGGYMFGNTGFTPCMGAAAMAMLVARTEPNYFIGGFTTSFIDLGITANDTLPAAMEKARRRNFGGTDTSVAIQHALRQKFPVDCFVIISDGETWAGSKHTDQALADYRNRTGRNAKLVVMNMVANTTSLVDREVADPGSLNVVGFDASVPEVIRMHVNQ